MNNYLFSTCPKHRSHALVTGVTGLLGQYLMRDLILGGHPVAVLVRSSDRESAVQRVNSILTHFENEHHQSLPRPIIIDGDVCKPSLGLTKRQIRWVAENCDSILHNAASLQFFGGHRSAEPWRTNVGGTERVLELARRTEIGELHYVSTAYVCGKGSSPVFESDLDRGQEFRNDYEHSKFDAEQLVQAAKHLHSKTIYRPVVIAGDSQTGYTSTYHGLFLYLRLIATIVPMLRQDSEGRIETSVQLPLDGDEPRNLVPVDWVSQVITRLFSDRSAHGRTYHLSPDECLTTKEFIDYCCEYFHTYGVQYVGRNGTRECQSELARLFENVQIYQDYEIGDPHFDKSNLLKFAGHLPCPRIDKETIFRFIEFGQANRWGKSLRNPVLPNRMEDLALPLPTTLSRI